MYLSLSAQAASGLRLAFCLVAGALVSSCGGGGNTESAPPTNAGVADAQTVDNTARRQVAGTTETWTPLASENQSFTTTGTQVVRFGNPWVAWVQKTITGAGQCTNAFFGSDPIQGVSKVCQVQAQGGGSLTVSWSTPSQNTDGTSLSNISGYRIAYGTSPSSLSQSVNVSGSTATSVVIGSLASGTTYHFAVSTANTGGTYSALSGTVSSTVP